MKLQTLTLAALLVVALGATATAQITNSKHDFANNAPTGITETQICKPCHAPHNPAAGGEGVLWNHEVTTQTFTMFGTATPGAAGTTTAGSTTDTAPGPASLKCLSCHDGQTAIDNYGGVTTGTVKMSAINGGAADVGLDLNDDHPIGVQYPSAGRYNAKSGNNVGVLPLKANASASWTDGVECATCHNPHGEPSVNKFLRVTEAGSQICLVCHNQ